MQVWQPASLAEAAAMLARPGAQAMAGGTALQLDWARGVARPGALVALGGLLPCGIEREGTRWRIGAGTTLAEVEAAGIPLLSAAMADIAAPGVRRLATIGGTIGWGSGCLIPALLVAECQLDTTLGVVALAEWLAAPLGLILSLTLCTPQDAQIIWRKVSLRAAFSPAVIVVAGLLGDSRALAVGGGPVRPTRLPRSEVATTALTQSLLEEITAPDCAFRSGAYRRRVAAGLLAGAITTPAPSAPAPQGVLTPDGPRWHQRPDMAAKVAGTFPFLTDHRAPDMLVGRILRAAHPHARILSIDTTLAEALPGVRAVVTHRDVPGLNAFGIMWQDQPALCADVVRYTGDAVAAVAAVDAATAEAALALIRVDYALLPVVDDPEQALSPGAPALHPNGNLAADLGHRRGDTAAAFAAAAHQVEATYVTPRQMHGFLETEGGYAVPQPDGGVLIAVGGQHGARDRMQLARILNLPEAQLRVITSPTGGAFGGKDELTVQAPLALLALKAGAPVRLHLSRAESVAAGTKRSPMRIRMRTACDAEGRLVAQEVDLIADAGAYASLSPAVVETALEHAAGPYTTAHVTTRGRLVHTNNGTCGAFRGFGANQMAYAVECQMDRLAAACGLSPMEMRRRNLRGPGDPGFLGQAIAPSDRLSQMLQAAADSPLWAESGPDVATGMALNWQGTGLGTLPEDRAAGTLRLAADGRIEVLCGLDEMGQGLLAGLQAVVADRLGCARSDVRPIVGDTGAAPDSGSTTASRGGYVVWRLADLAAPGFARDLLTAGCRRLSLPEGALRLCPGGLVVVGSNSAAAILTFADLAQTDRPEASASFDFPKAAYTGGNARFIFESGATLARVQLDRATGQVRVLDLHLHTAAGPVIDLASYLGQIEGGAVQGLGFTLTEDVLYRSGLPVTTNLDTYLMPTIQDRPLRLAVTADETLDPGDPYGPRGVGELGIGAVTPAIANAIAALTGRWPQTAPFAPEEML